MRCDRRTLAVALAGFCAFLGTYATQPILPLLTRVFHASKVSVSLTVTATTVAVALIAPFVGALADMAGRKRVIVPAIFCLAIPTALAATSGSLHALIGWRFAQGLFMPAVFAVTIAYVSEEWAGDGVGAATAAYVSGTVLGGFCGRTISGLVTEQWGWRAAFLVLGAITALCGAATWAWLPRAQRFKRSPDATASARAIGGHLRNPRLLATYAIGFNVLFSLVATFTYVTFHLAAPPFHLGTAALGSVFVVYLLGVVITPIAGRWIDRLGFRTMLVCAMTASCGGVLLTLVPALWAVVLGLAICSSGVFVTQVAANSYIGVAARGARAAAVGLYVTCYYIGGAVGAALPGTLWSIGGWPACVALVAGVQLLTVCFALAFWGRPAERGAPSPDMPAAA